MGEPYIDAERRAFWRQLVQEEHTTIYSLACWLTGSPQAAAALSCEAFTAVYRESGCLVKDQVLKSVVAAACRLFLDHYCKSQQVEFALDEREALVLRELLIQKPQNRLIIVLHYFLKLNREELSKILNWPKGLVDRILNTALQNMQANFLEMGLISCS